MQILFYCIFQIIEDREPILKIFVKENITLELLLYKMLVIPLNKGEAMNGLARADFSGNKENCVNGIYKISYKEPAH